MIKNFNNIKNDSYKLKNYYYYFIKFSNIYSIKI